MSCSSMASTVRIFVLLLAIFPSNFPSLVAQSWIKAGYWYSAWGIPISDINSNLFTHLICGFAVLNNSTYELSISPSYQNNCSSFSTTVKQKNPSVVTLLSIGGQFSNFSFSSMVIQLSHRKSFINSSINLARKYGFEGLDFSWPSAETAADMSGIGTLLQEWRIAIESESRNKNISKLILTMVAQIIPLDFEPVESIRKNLDWIHVRASGYYTPENSRNKTRAPAALYDPASNFSTDFGIQSWINRGMPSKKVVLSLPFYGYAWTLEDPRNNAIGAPAIGPARLLPSDGAIGYKNIMEYIRTYNGVSSYNGTYVMKYCTIGSTWFGFDDAEVVKIKVSYAKQMNLRGYVAWQVSYDDNWELSQAAAGVEKNHQSKWRILLKILLPIATVIILVLGIAMWYKRKKFMLLQERKPKGKMKLKNRNDHMTAIRSRDSHESQMFSFDEINAATNNFSSENKLGEGGYGPVYKGRLRNGQEVAVKRLSETSKQGFEEFKNELLLNETVQHVNLVMVLGFCVEREEKMLIYEYMPNRSLDFYIFDPVRRYILDWEKRVGIIEGVTQGLLYLQEYSRLKVIHRDLKASNILLDTQMKPKISDFGLARIFQKDEFEANTSHVVGTYGYVPPEYVKQGIYSTKSDVFGFGVLLLQIISGRKNTCFYGPQSNLNLLEYAYEQWKDGRGKEFMEESLDDSSSSCKLIKCMQIALQCVQEDPSDRPTMLEISQMLKNDQNIGIKCLKRPAFSNKKDDDGVKMPISSSAGRTDLVDTATITTVVAR